MAGEVISAPPGAWLLDVTRPVTRITVSSVRSLAAGLAVDPASTTWARPARSLMIRKVTDLSSRLRCSQPEMVTYWPMCWLSSLARTRVVDMRHSQARRAPWGVRARRELAVPPHLRRGSPATASWPGHGGWPAGHWTCCWRRQSFLPALRRVFDIPGARPPSQLPAALSARVTGRYLAPSAR